MEYLLNTWRRILLEYSIQQTGKDVLEREFDLKPPQYFLSNTRHYSWPKGAGMPTMDHKKGRDADTTKPSQESELNMWLESP